MEANLYTGCMLATARGRYLNFQAVDGVSFPVMVNLLLLFAENASECSVSHLPFVWQVEALPLSP